MKLIVVTTVNSLKNEASILTNLFELGLPTLHLRKPKYSTRRLKSLIEKIPFHFHNRIIIHSHHMLALTYQLKGIHLTKQHKKSHLKTLIKLRYLKFRRPELVITTSHTKISNILERNRNYDYVFLSPIFDSATSKYQAGFTEHSLKGAVKKSPYRIVARGGVEAHHIEKVANIGFYGLVMHSTMWTTEDPVNELTQFLKIFKELHIPIE